MKYNYLTYNFDKGASQHVDRRLLILAAGILIVIILSTVGFIANRSNREVSTPASSNGQSDDSSANQAAGAPTPPDTNATNGTPAANGAQPIGTAPGTGGANNIQGSSPNPSNSSSNFSSVTPAAPGDSVGGRGGGSPTETTTNECPLDQIKVSGICQCNKDLSPTSQKCLLESANSATNLSF